MRKADLIHTEMSVAMRAGNPKKIKELSKKARKIESDFESLWQEIFKEKL